MSAAIERLERMYKAALRAEETASTTERAQILVSKTERVLNQLKLAKMERLPPVAKKVEKRLEQMIKNDSYENIVEFISSHHYGGCGCGCGTAVVKLFKQGHDMKLKSRIKSEQTAS